MNDDEQLHPEEHEQEYEAQFFGFTAFSVIDQVYDTKNIAVDEAVLLTYRTLMKKYEYFGKDVIRKGCAELRDDIMKSLDKICDKLEVYLLSNILFIPKTLVLPEDTIHQDDHLQTVDESSLDENIKMLKSQIKNVTDSLAIGYREKAQLDPLLDKYQNMLSMLYDMETSFKDDGLQLEEDMEIIKSNMVNLLDNKNLLEPMDIVSHSSFCDSDEVENQ